MEVVGNCYGMIFPSHGQLLISRNVPFNNERLITSWVSTWRFWALLQFFSSGWTHSSDLLHHHHVPLGIAHGKVLRPWVGIDLSGALTVGISYKSRFSIGLFFFLNQGRNGQYQMCFFWSAWVTLKRGPSGRKGPALKGLYETDSRNEYSNVRCRQPQ